MGMNSERYNDLEQGATLRQEMEARTLERALEARRAIATELGAMKSKDQILMLSNEEERMLRAFRAFRLRCKPGAVFKWQTHPENDGVVLAEETGLIADPQEIA